jgi:hypothetical protein
MARRNAKRKTRTGPLLRTWRHIPIRPSRAIAAEHRTPRDNAGASFGRARARACRRNR